MQTYAQIGIQQNAEWLRKAHQVQHDAVRTNNLPQLDNSDYFAEFERVRHSPQRTLASDAAAGVAAANDSNAPARLPAVRTRISVRWGDLWFDGVVTACKKGLDANGREATVSHILYDAAHGYRPSRRWHSLLEEDWRRI